MPPDLIAGRYRIDREIGRGGMGTVWLCRDERLGREVAVKQVGGLPGESSMHFARALREARHSAALNHPHVVSMFDAIEDGNVVWLVMEYVESRTLGDIIRTDGALPPERAARIGAQVADGLAAAHARGTVHRDVKPSNILVAEGDVAKISDFGIARTMDEEQLTRSGLVTGTPSYFSPEQARGEEPTTASDVWALGASLYAAVEGRPLYPEQPNAIAMLRVIAEGEPPAAQRAAALGPALARMLEADPSRRWSMAEAAQELARLGNRGAPATEAPTRLMEAAPTAPAPAPESPPPAAAPAPVDTRPRPVAVTGSSGRRAPALVGLLLLVLVAAAAGGYLLTRDPSSPAADPGAERTASAEPSQDRDPDASGPESEQPPDDAPDGTPGETAEPQGDTDPAPDAAGPAELVADYYTVLPEDTESGWQMLAPPLQNEIGRDSFEGFWASIDDVTVEQVTPDGDGAVLATIVYSTGSGSEQETRRLVVGEAGGGLVITDDQGPV